MIRILHLSSTVNARDIIRANVRESKSIVRNLRDLVEFADGTKVTFGYVGQNFTGQRFDLIIEDESVIEWHTRNMDAYIRFIDKLKYRITP